MNFTALFDMIKMALFCFVEPEVTKEKAKPTPGKKGLIYFVFSFHCRYQNVTLSLNIFAILLLLL